MRRFFVLKSWILIVYLLTVLSRNRQRTRLPERPGKTKQIMAIKITDECINCGACEPECPNNAIYEGGAEWRYADGTGVKGVYKGRNSGTEADVNEPQTPKSMDLYFIVSDK